MGKDNSATPKTGVLGEDNPAVRRVGSDRMAALDALAGARREEVSAESGVDIPAPKADADQDTDTDTDTSVVDPDAKKAAADTAAAEARERAETAAAAEKKAKADAAKLAAAADDELGRQMLEDGRVVLTGDLSRYVVRAKVDGEDQDHSLEKVTRLLQKDAAVDRRLEDATRIKKEAEAKERAAEEALQKARSTGDQEAIKRAKAEHADANATLDEAKGHIKAAAEALYAGDTEAATESLSKVLAGRTEKSAATQEVDIDAIASVVVRKVEHQTALRNFETAYPEIVASEPLAAMADKEIKELMQHDGLSFTDALVKAGETVRQSVRDMAKGLGMTESTERGRTRVDRTSRKAEIDGENPRRAGAAQANATTENQADTPSNVIARMREERLNPQLARQRAAPGGSRT